MEPEMHTFHMPFGVMTVTLQDVSMLTGLPIRGSPIGPSVIDLNWREDLAQRFQLVLPNQEVNLNITANKRHGPQRQWLKLFRVS